MIGCAAINPDGGSYPQWEAEVTQMLDRYRGAFGHNGLALSLQRTRCSRCLLLCTLFQLFPVLQSLANAPANGPAGSRYCNSMAWFTDAAGAHPAGSIGSRST